MNIWICMYKISSRRAMYMNHACFCGEQLWKMIMTHDFELCYILSCGQTNGGLCLNIIVCIVKRLFALYVLNYQLLSALSIF